MAALAVGADAAHRAVFDDHPVAGLDAGHILAGLHYFGGDLVAQGHVLAVPVAHEVDVGAADAAGVHLDDDVVLVGSADIAATRSCDVQPLAPEKPSALHIYPPP